MQGIVGIRLAVICGEFVDDQLSNGVVDVDVVVIFSCSCVHSGVCSGLKVFILKLRV